MNIRMASVWLATATEVRPFSSGSPWPLISVQVTPSSVDLNRCVPLGPPKAPRAVEPGGT